jgi:photosystem II stability/assembly factor-like uncharacterized protein
MKKYLLIIVLLINIPISHAQWFIQNDGINIGQIRDSYFLNENIGWLLVNGNRTFYTCDGGDMWNCIDTLPCFIDKIFFVDSLNGWGAGNNRIIKTQDGGNSWSIQYENNDSINFQQYRDVFFTDLIHGWVVNYETVLITTNGGAAWQPVNIDIWAPWSVYFINESIGWIVGDQGKVIKTTDGGNTWVNQISNTDGDLNDVEFIDETHGWAVGTDWISGWQSLILRTLDGGVTWDPLVIYDGQTLYSVSFTDTLNGWACGSYGTIFHTDDGGITWDSQESPSSNYLIKIHFVTENIGWATGSSGTIIKTINGGIVGIDNSLSINKENIQIFPNPTHGLIHILIQEKITRIELYSITGNRVRNEYLNSEKTIDIKCLDKGVYLIKLYSGKNIYTEKIIKE